MWLGYDLSFKLFPETRLQFINDLVGCLQESFRKAAESPFYAQHCPVDTAVSPTQVSVLMGLPN